MKSHLISDGDIIKAWKLKKALDKESVVGKKINGRWLQYGPVDCQSGFLRMDWQKQSGRADALPVLKSFLCVFHITSVSFCP